MARPTAKKTEKEISVLPVQRQVIEFAVIGRTPLICNRVAEKAKRELLFPSAKKTKADKQASLKHDPMTEFRASPYTSRDKESPTFLTFPSLAFKSALRNAAIDMPGGAAKAQIGRLTYVQGDYVPLWGIPMLYMAITRNSDMARTPDVRTRVIVPEWACTIRVEFVTPILTATAVANLLSGAGLTQGVGDFRTEKGKGDYGQFRICNTDDAAYQRIISQGGRAAQIEAMNNPTCYDSESEELLGWFLSEVEARGMALQESNIDE